MTPPRSPHVDPADLTALLFGDLSAASCRRVTEHLESCRECRDHFHELETLLAALPRQAQEISRQDVQRIQAKVASRLAHRRTWLPALAVGCCAAVAIVFFSTGQPRLTPKAESQAMVGELELLQNLELLQSLELLENLELLEELESRG